MIDTDVPNAFATGRNPKHAAVAVTSGLWERLEPREVEGVLAHELSHIANRDVLIMTVASFFAMLAGLLARYSVFFGGGGDRDRNGPPIWLIVLVVSIVTYALSYVLIRTISRYREYAADRGAALITGAPENLMSALQKISSRDRVDPAARPARGPGDERVLHHPDERALGVRRALRDAPAAREAARRARGDRARDGPPGLGGPHRRPLRPQEAERGAGRAALRALDRTRHARRRARAEAGRSARRSCSSRSRPATSSASRTSCTSCSTSRRATPARA